MLVQAAGMALRDGASLDWDPEFISHLLVAGACTSECIFATPVGSLCYSIENEGEESA